MGYLAFHTALHTLTHASDPVPTEGHGCPLGQGHPLFCISRGQHEAGMQQKLNKQYLLFVFVSTRHPILFRALPASLEKPVLFIYCLRQLGPTWGLEFPHSVSHASGDRHTWL